MSVNGLEVFDRTLQITHIWLDEIIEELHTDRHTAWRVLGAVLRALRDRLPPGLSAHLSAELPLLVRGAYFEQWRPGEETLKQRTLAEFLERVSAGLAQGKPIGSLDATRTVFAVLNHHVDPGQIEKVRQALPTDVRDLWPKREIVEPMI
jgi:uncharacterized protein (DUF2267 family)